MLEIGMIHGRYQPFHNGHFEYLVQALGCVKKLIVGITNPDPGYTKQVESDSHRHLPGANPFSYYLRMRMIQNSILSDDKLQERYPDVIVTPFPINMPECWKHYILSDAVQIMRILDPWDQEKQKLFQTYGFQVVVLEGKRVASGTEIRKDIDSGGKDWRQKVPLGTLEVLERWLRQKAA
ncbi:MAG TPA: adenylyltransferase/cytidyltransferase family protein [Anaerolineae bacterium]|nr:adenylyltransferase/cytidyltransferase family protein [Anaerolineae bacterium]